MTDVSRGGTEVSAETRRPLTRRIQQRAFKVVNVPMRVVLQLPFATPLTNRLMLAYLTGRKTGKTYRQPLSYVRDGEALLTPGGGNWKLNLKPGRPERLKLRGRDVLARPEIVREPDDVERLLAVMEAGNPMASRFVAIPKGPDGRLDRARLEAALRYGFRIVRWHIVDSPPSVAVTGPGSAPQR